MDKVTTAARILLGLIFTVFGLNGFFNFIPVPEMQPAAGEFVGALVASGYMMTWVKATEFVCGLLLLSGRFVPLALVVLAPIVLNIFALHLFLDPAGLAVPVVVVVLALLTARGTWSSFRELLRATPSE